MCTCLGGSAACVSNGFLLSANDFTVGDSRENLASLGQIMSKYTSQPLSPRMLALLVDETRFDGITDGHFKDKTLQLSKKDNSTFLNAVARFLAKADKVMLALVGCKS